MDVDGGKPNPGLMEEKRWSTIIEALLRALKPLLFIHNNK